MRVCWGIWGTNVNLFFMLLLQRFPLRITTDIKAAGTDDDFRGPVCLICAAMLNTFRKGKEKKREDKWRLVFSHTCPRGVFSQPQQSTFVLRCDDVQRETSRALVFALIFVCVC